MTEVLLVDRSDGIAILTLNRPERLNALNDELMDAFHEGVRNVADDPEIGCVIVTGAGRGFCSGGDLKDGAAGRLQEQAAGELLRRRAEAARILREMPKITIAMVNGPVAGAGIGIAGACDLRFAAQSATFLSAYTNIGAGGDFGATYVWSKILGAAKAREIFLLNEKFGAEKALSFGLYTRVYPDEALVGETLTVARRLTVGPRSSWAYMKANLNSAEEEPFPRHLDRESANMGLSTRAFFAASKAERRPKGE